MGEILHLGDVAIAVTRKNSKHVHLSVLPPAGRVTMTAPLSTRIEAARTHAISKLSWIRRQQRSFRGQARETPRRFVERASHYVWGRRYFLTVKEVEAKPRVSLGPRRLVLAVRPGSSFEKRAAVLHGWHKELPHAVIPELVKKWEPRLGVRSAGYFLQRMKTKRGICNPRAKAIRLNTELVKKPKDLLEYVVVHELIHLLAPTHDDRFITLLSRHLPSWREAKAELNELPLGAGSGRSRSLLG